MFSVLLICMGIVFENANSIATESDIRNFTRPTGKISTPRFPMKYGNYLDCYNYIPVPTGQRVIIMFLEFRTDSSDDYMTITCESGNPFRSPRYYGFFFPAVLTISSCNLLKVYFHSDSYSYDIFSYGGFSLSYNMTSDNVTGGITSKPSNAFLYLEDDRPSSIAFNCTTRSNYLPWWTFIDTNSGKYTITNSSCGTITSASYSSRFLTESLGPGSCNVILVASAAYPYYLAGNLVCTDSTLSSATAIIQPKGRNFASIYRDICR
jgi:hypothetical protein